jgi:hypothetical protein
MGKRIRPAVAAGTTLLALLALAPGAAAADPAQHLVSGPIVGIDDGEVCGPIVGIDDGKVKAAGKSGRFVVKNRHVTGTLSGVVGDDEPLAGVPFTLTFGTNVPLMSQSGNLHGVLSFGPYQARVTAKSEIGLTPLGCDGADGCTCMPTTEGNFRPGLIIEGVATFTHGTTGHGTASAWLIPMIDETGHIIGVFGQMTLSTP